MDDDVEYSSKIRRALRPGAVHGAGRTAVGAVQRHDAAHLRAWLLGVPQGRAWGLHVRRREGRVRHRGRRGRGVP
jgi:hypothetical protein